MDKELKKILFEIISFVLFLAIVIPICVNASDKYNEQKPSPLNRFNSGIFVLPIISLG